ncbi:coenzyme F420-0:L-glutamate ligase [Nocardioides sp. R-C-SC26]|uniref:coenzyme F420-0:L-glutamate ligase n=1 Tax=Nocardioides sp. R-C-SC26 TaxID=2870414 RepID=UPI001E596839|nr:coenzyme F420-0:L-glutamate ligase [Nocardioides sp. R-C-SC26]
MSAYAPDGAPEVREGDDLAAILLGLTQIDPRTRLRDGDVVVVTSKVVSKSEGRTGHGTRDDHLAAETARVVARRGPTTIVRTHHGLTLAAAGIDASNTVAGTVVLLPRDPDGSARALRSALHAALGDDGPTVGVVVTDTAGRAWRDGQTDIAIGAAGLRVSEDFAGRRDGYGNDLVVTAPAVAGGVAGVGGRGDLVLPRGDAGPGAGALIRDDGADLFGFGAREAVLRAIAGEPEDRRPFGTSVPAEELVLALTQALGIQAVQESPAHVSLMAPDAVTSRLVDLVAFTHGWDVDDAHRGAGTRHLRPTSP